MMENEFQMSMMGELTFFLGIQVNQIMQGNDARFRWKWQSNWSKGVQEDDLLPLVPHGDTTEHSIHGVPMCMLSSFSMQFTSASCLADLQLVLLGFPMLILMGVELREKALLVHIIFLDLLLFVGLLTNNLLLHNPQ
jgi:hypothetical protein